MPAEIVVPIAHEMDIVTARQRGRGLLVEMGFPATDQTLVATAISEVARNILVYAERGEIVISVVEEGLRRGIQVVARDRGPGIRDTALALQDGYSTSGSLGLGLPGCRRLMDELDLVSTPGVGTTVTMRKWVP